MPPSIQRVTSVTMVGTPPVSSVLLNWLEGTVTEIDFNSVPVATAIDTRHAAKGVTFELVDKNGARIGNGNVVTAVGPGPMEW